MRAVKELADLTAIYHIRYDVRKKNCMCYTKYPDTEFCPNEQCNLPLLNAQENPWRTFDYILVLH